MDSPVIAKAYVAGALVVTPTTYAGITLRETAGAAANVRVWDNALAGSGRLLDVVHLDANQSVWHYCFEEGVRAQNGIFLETVAGAVEGSVYVA